MKEEMKTILDKHVLSFAKYTITDRAIPNLTDGLKPIHKRILWSMYLDGLYHTKKRTKSANAVGSVLRFSPHGDSSIYEAMVRMTNDSLNYPLLDGKGSFSSVTTTAQAGAPRYTNIRMGKISSEIMNDIKKGAVEMGKNYDETMDEPLEMPAPMPLILLNPSRGIAMGIASNICSFNMGDVFENVKNIINGKKTFPMYPDFPTGGIVNEDLETIKKVKESGRGTFKIRAKYELDKRSILIKEIPYGTNREAIISSITDGAKSGVLKEVIDVNDNTGVNGLEIEIECKKGADLEVLMAKLFKVTPLESTFSCNFNVLLNNKPVTLGTDDILKEWVKFRRKTIVNVFNYDLGKIAKDLYQLYGLQKVLLDVDKAIEIIKNSNTDEEMLQELVKVFDIDYEQAQNISNMKLRNINKTFIVNKTKQIEKLEKETKDIKDIINNESKIDKIIVEELEKIEQEYGKERYTKVGKFFDIPTETIMVEDYNVKVFLTKEGYIKKVPLTSLRGNYSLKVKDDDEIIKEFETTNTAELVVLTDKRNIYKKKLHEIQDNKPSNLGEYIPTMLSMSDETPLFSFVTSDFSEKLIVCFEDGKVAKIEVSAYETKQNRSLLKNGYADKNAVYFDLLGRDEDVDLFAKSSIGKVILFNTSMVNSKTSKTTIGNTVLKEKDDSKAVLFVRKEDTNVEDPEYYRVKNAGVGKYLRKEDIL